MTNVMTPANSGIGVGPNNPAPANLSNSSMAQSAAPASASAIPFTRGSTDGTMADFQGTVAFNAGQQIALQTNAFLTAIEIELEVTTAGNTAAVAFNPDAPWNLIKLLQFNDPANQAIITPISGYGLYLANKYLPETGCLFDPKLDPNYEAVTGTAANGGSISIRLIVPIEIRHRDAFGALANSAANQRFLLTINTGATTDLYATAPTVLPTNITMKIYQHYWTSPPAFVTSTSGQVAVAPEPSGLGTVGFMRYERHNEVSGGGAPPIQITSVGDYIETLIFVLRNTSNARESTDWPDEFDFWVNDFQTQALNIKMWQREMARVYKYDSGAAEAPGGLDNGVFVLTKTMGLFDKMDNFALASQYIPTTASSKLQIRGSTWGAGASYLEVYVRSIRPNSAAALFG